MAAETPNTRFRRVLDDPNNYGTYKPGGPRIPVTPTWHYIDPETGLMHSPYVPKVASPSRNFTSTWVETPNARFRRILDDPNNYGKYVPGGPRIPVTPSKPYIDPDTGLLYSPYVPKAPSPSWTPELSPTSKFLRDLDRYELGTPFDIEQNPDQVRLPRFVARPRVSGGERFEVDPYWAFYNQETGEMYSPFVPRGSLRRPSSSPGGSPLSPPVVYDVCDVHGDPMEPIKVQRLAERQLRTAEIMFGSPRMQEYRKCFPWLYKEFAKLHQERCFRCYDEKMAKLLVQKEVMMSAEDGEDVDVDLQNISNQITARNKPVPRRLMFDEEDDDDADAADADANDADLLDDYVVLDKPSPRQVAAEAKARRRKRRPWYSKFLPDLSHVMMI